MPMETKAMLAEIKATPEVTKAMLEAIKATLVTMEATRETAASDEVVVALDEDEGDVVAGTVLSSSK